MRLMGINIVIVILVFAIALTGIIYAKDYQHSISVDRPLAEYLSSNGLVNDYQINADKNEIIIDAKWQDDLNRYINDMTEKIQDISNDEYKVITVKDHRNRELGDLFYNVHFAINEAMSTGNYVDMEKSVDDIAEKAGVDKVKVWITDSSVLFQVKKGENFLYQSVARQNNEDTNIPAVRFEAS